MIFGIKEFFLKYRLETLGGILLFLGVLINRFPEGYIFLGGDVIQHIKMTENFVYYHYEWFGRASLFYGVFYLLDSFHVSETAQLSWYLGIFLIGSYFSFLTFTSLLFPYSSRIIRTLTALFYATNIYTLYVFTASWGYSHYQILYIFIPILTGLYTKTLQTKRVVLMLTLLVAVFFASASFGNPAFAFSLGIYFFLLTIFLFLFRVVNFDSETLKRIVVIIIGSLFLNAYWILPLMPQLRSGVQSIYTSEFVNLSERLQKTSNSIFDTIRLLPTSEQDRYYPYNFPYVSMSWMKKYVGILAFLPILLVCARFVERREKKEQKLFGLFFAMFIVIIALVARVRFPFEIINSFIFQLPGMNTLRGYDKLATLAPFLLSSLLLLALLSFSGKRYFRSILIGFFILTIILSLPFYAGGLQTKMSYILSTQKNKDFHTAKQSALVKIPDPYYAVAPILQGDQGDYKVSMLPYSPGSSVGRVSLPEWKVNGPYPTEVLYEKQYVELYGYYIPGWMFAKDFENAQYDPKWIVDLYGLIGVKYVFYHNDAKQGSMDNLEPAKKYLEKIGALHVVNDNKSFTLYAIDDQRLFPYLYSATDVPPIKLQPDGLSSSVQAFHNQITPLMYQRKNPKAIVIEDSVLKGGADVLLNEKYDPLWRAEYIMQDGKPVLLERDEGVKYANAWKVNENLAGGSLEVYYAAVRLLFLGEGISGTTLLGVIFGIVWVVRRKNKV